MVTWRAGIHECRAHTKMPATGPRGDPARGRCYHRPPRVPRADLGIDVRSNVARGSRKGREDGTASVEGRRKQRIGLRRLLGLAVLLPLASRAPLYGRLMWELVRDDRTPGGRKAMLAGALGYLVLGRDLVPGDFRVIGGLDDLAKKAETLGAKL